jgi:MYXO-CTERM domain-containing protein
MRAHCSSATSRSRWPPTPRWCWPVACAWSRPAWNHDAFEIVAREGTPEVLPVVDDPELAEGLSYLPVGRVRTHEGDAVELVYQASGHRFVSAPIVTSRADEAASLELVAFYDTQVDEPATVHAIVTDSAGRRVVGAPIEWTLSAGLREGEEDVLSRDVLEIDGGCDVEARHAIVEASYGDLHADLDLQWTCARRDPDLDLFEDDEGVAEDDPLLGCSCRSTPSSGGGPLLLVIAGALAWRRRAR